MKLQEMVTSADVGVDLIPERCYKETKKKIKELCDFKKHKVSQKNRKKHKEEV